MSADASRADFRGEARGMGEVVLAMALAGSSVVVGKLLSVRIPVFLSVELSLCAALGWLSVIYYGAFATVIAYILWGDGALRIPANKTGIATAALPVSALVLSALVLGEPLRLPHLAGCAAVIAGMIIGGKRGPQEDRDDGNIRELEKAVPRGSGRSPRHEGRAQSPDARGA
jgi:drug/metabolite transporter (DMT)-like permease